MTAAGNQVSEVRMPSALALDRLEREVLQLRRYELSHMLADEKDEIADMDREIEAIRARIAAARGAYEKMIASPEERALYDEFGRLLADYYRVSDKTLVLSRENEDQKAFTIQKAEGRPLFAAVLAALDKDVEANVREAHAATAHQNAVAGQMKATILAMIALVVALTLGIGAMLRSATATPIVAMTEAMKRLAEGDKGIDIPARGRKDEIGAMAAAVQVFKDNAIRADRLAAEREAEQAAREARAQAIEGLTGDFDRMVSSSLEVVAGAATEMEATAQGMSANAEQTNRQATTVAAATEQATASVQTVASAAEELSSSIAEIGRQVAQSARLSLAASEEAGRTNATVKGLAESSARIGDVVKLINDIASQTNLLALNATIEAARAGDAGKGFAVVAGEVKNLANQTAKATEEIGTQIGAVQAATNEAVGAISSIVGRIEEINQIAAAIASAVEEQSAATAEIARNVQHAAGGTQEVADNIGGVTQAAAETGAAAGQVLSSARSLSREAEQLKQVVGRFLEGVRRA